MVMWGFKNPLVFFRFLWEGIICLHCVIMCYIYIIYISSLYLPFFGTWGFTRYLPLGFRGEIHIQLGESEQKLP